MKLIHAITSTEDAHDVSKALTKAGISSTKLASTGGFLMSNNTTFIIAVEDNLVDKAIAVIKSQSKKRTQLVPPAATFGLDMLTPIPVEVTVGGATIVVTNIERFEKI